MMVTLLRWILAIGFAGVLIHVILSFKTLPQDQKSKYYGWFILSIVLIGLATLAQMLLAGVTT